MDTSNQKFDEKFDESTPDSKEGVKLTNQKLTRLTNLWCKILGQGEQKVSCVAIESIHPLDYAPKENGQAVTLTIRHAVANMCCETINVHDGLIEEISIQAGPGEEKNVFVRITCSYQVPFQITCQEGIPARTFLHFDRSFLGDIFSTQKIVLDPGHGGSDPGGRGPVDLLEKNVALIMARQLKTQFTQLGAQVFLTRGEDQDLPLGKRLNLARENKADFFISLHTNCSQDAKISGLAVNYNPLHPDGLLLAQIMSEELVKKLKRSVLETKEDLELAGLGLIPGLKIKPLTISNWVEEGMLRNPTMYEKIAIATLNSLRRYLTGKEKNPSRTS